LEKKWKRFRDLLSTFREMWSAFLLSRSEPLQGGLRFVRAARDRVHALSGWRFLPSPFTSLLNILILSAEGVKQKDENAALPPSPDKGRNNRQNEKLSANCEQRINPVFTVSV
jgi:hypothetical protein